MSGLSSQALSLGPHESSSTQCTTMAAVYLALSLPPVEFPTRKTLDYWLPTAAVHWPWLRHILETGAILSISLLLALLFPSSSANVSVESELVRIAHSA